MKSIKKLFTAAWLSLTLLLTSQVFAYEVPALTTPVMDQVRLLNSSTAQTLNQNLHDFRNKTGVQIQVLILNSLNDEPIENVAIQVFDQWKLGDAKKDNGLLFLIAPNERRLRIEVGQGLEGAVPDAIAKRIIAEVVTPLFKRGQFDLGVQSGVSALQHYVQTGETDLAPHSEQVKLPAKYLILVFLILFGIIFLFSPSLAMQILFALLSGGRGGGRGGGGGGWSGGGGSSSGGGASGSW